MNRTLIRSGALLLGALSLALAAQAQFWSSIGQPSGNVKWPPDEWPTTFWPAKSWPWSPKLDSVTAAPHNYSVLWESDKLRLVEVLIRPGETVPLHDEPYPAVLGFDAPIPDSSLIVDAPLVKDDPRNDALGARGSPPPNKSYPTCATSAPQAPLRITNHGDFPIHYYRVEYKRIDGDGLAANWRKWYPWMQYMPFIQGYDVRTN
jgi:hypothetical protein